MGSNVGKKNSKQNIEYGNDRNRGDGYNDASKSSDSEDSDNDDYSDTNYDDSEDYKSKNEGSMTYATTTKSSREKPSTTKSQSETNRKSTTNTEKFSKPSAGDSAKASTQPTTKRTEVVAAEKQPRVGPEQKPMAPITSPDKPDDVKIQMPAESVPHVQDQRPEVGQPIIVKKKRGIVKQLSEQNTSMVRLFLAELLGTTIFILFARGAKAQVIFGRHLLASTLNQTEMDPSNFNYLMYGDTMAMAVGAGIGYAVGIGVTMAVSGGHLNPAISFAMLVWRMIDCCSFIIYLCSQHLGSMLGILLVYSLQSKTMQELDIKEPYISSQVFGPSKNSHIFGAYILMWKEFIGASCLVIGFFALNDKYNTVSTPEFRGLIPFFMGLLVSGLHLISCLLSCTEFNPAADIAGRLFYLASGHGTDVVTSKSAHFWIPVLIPYMGALWGSLLYKSIISWHWPELKTKEISKQPPRLIMEEKIIDAKAPMDIGITRGTQVERHKLMGQDPILPQKKVAVVEYQREPKYDEIARFVFDALQNTVMMEQYKKTLKAAQTVEEVAKQQKEAKGKKESEGKKGGGRGVKSDSTRTSSFRNKYSGTTKSSYGTSTTFTRPTTGRKSRPRKRQGAKRATIRDRNARRGPSYGRGRFREREYGAPGGGRRRGGGGGTRGGGEGGGGDYDDDFGEGYGDYVDDYDDYGDYDDYNDYGGYEEDYADEDEDYYYDDDYDDFSDEADDGSDMLYFESEDELFDDDDDEDEEEANEDDDEEKS